MRILSLLALLTLAACGAAGAPETPGVRVSGDVSAGIVSK